MSGIILYCEDEINFDGISQISYSEMIEQINKQQNDIKELQEENGADSEQLSATAFPETYADLSFTERMANATAGYEPFAGKSAYVIPDFQTESEYCPSHLDDPACAAYKEKSEKEQSKEDAKEKKKSIRKKCSNRLQNSAVRQSS